MDGIDRLNRNFLWGTSEAQKRIHWVGWQKVIESKEEGGLGLQTVKEKNIALLTKLNWRFHTEKEAPWAEVLRLKYCSNKGTNTINANMLLCSQIWVGVKKVREVLNKAACRWQGGKIT